MVYQLVWCRVPQELTSWTCHPWSAWVCSDESRDALQAGRGRRDEGRLKGQCGPQVCANSRHRDEASSEEGIYIYIYVRRAGEARAEVARPEVARPEVAQPGVARLEACQRHRPQW